MPVSVSRRTLRDDRIKIHKAPPATPNDMELERNITKGPYRDLLGMLTRSLGQYEHYYRHVKAGITGDPDTRAYSHDRDGWQRMVVRYNCRAKRVLKQTSEL